MSDSTASQIDQRHAVVPLALQISAWLLGMAACVPGMLDLVGNWKPEVATTQFVTLAIAPLLFMLPRRRRRATAKGETSNSTGVTRVDWLVCLSLGVTAFAVNYVVGIKLADLPPAYHDEFSYLFEAKTLLAGRLSYPSHAMHPELFDQMHVMNEGRMASRYYPGTGLWLAPFVAIGYPYVAAWIASVIATMLIYWAGRELGGRGAGLFAGLTLALSPGVALFGTTYLAHQPTLVSLTLFLLGVIRWQRTRFASDAWMAGCGLSFTMLCRPMTAAAMGLPFGIDVALWLIRPRPSTSAPAPSRFGTLIGFGIPLIVGWSVMAVYNQAVTGEWTRSPYQVYTDIYTPRHVYGFNNRVRGEQHLGPKVIEDYDSWAENLTPEVAARNMFVRWIASWQWTLDVVPILICTIVIAGMLWRLDRRWMLIVAAIVSLHALHAPYWYVGIMGWHYVFESVLLWCLIVGGATALLTADWQRRGIRGLSMWWCGLLMLSVTANFQYRIRDGIGALRYPRQRHADLRHWIEARVDQRPALVLIEQNDPHLDLVVNEPGLSADLLLGRYRPGKTDVKQIRRDFPDRSLYVTCPDRKEIKRIE
jgi:hypothetical protein